MGIEGLRDQLEGIARAHLSPADADLLTALARPAVRLDHSDGAPTSHVGGAARLPASLEWPAWTDKPLSLVAVVDLSDIAAFAIDLVLPTTGLLNFFYEADEQAAWGWDPEHRDGWRVVLVDPDEAVDRTPPEGALVFPRMGLAPSQTLTIPGWEEPAVATIYPPYWHHTEQGGFSRHSPDDSQGEEEKERKREAFWAVAEEWNRVVDWQAEPNHQVGGWPRLQQGPIWRECHVVSQGLPLGDARQSADPRIAELPAGEDEWRLLLQLDTDEEVGWMWGDVGTLFYAIRPSAEPSLMFRGAWMVLQCG